MLFDTADWAGTILMLASPIGIAFSIQENSSSLIAVRLALVFSPRNFLRTAYDFFCSWEAMLVRAAVWVWNPASEHRVQYALNLSVVLLEKYLRFPVTLFFVLGLVSRVERHRNGVRV